jgi:molecular chaperone DnaK
MSQQKDKGTGKERRIQIQASGGLSKADIERMVKDAESHAADDKKRKEAVEAKNSAEALLHETEKTLGEHGAKLADADRRAIENAMANLREALKGDNAAAITAKLNVLQRASGKLGEAIYANPQNSTGAAAEPGSDNIVDAEFTEDDTQKK